MPYINRKIANVKSKKAYEILLNLNYDMKTAQRLIDRKRLMCDGVVIKEKNAILSGEISLIEYECQPRGLSPMFECEDFAVFEKPTGVLSHPNGRNCEYSLSDEIWHLYGREASVAHRLDFETSGLIVVAKNRASQVELKALFESRAVSKNYIAMVQGRILPNILAKKFYGFSVKNELEFCVNLPMDLSNNYDDVKTRMKISQNGKNALTEFEILEYSKNLDTTLLRCFPLTGRQHQIRLHLFHIGHKILGDPLYGLKRDDIIKILDKKIKPNERFKLTGATRLLLHADEISFKFIGHEYKFKSRFNTKDEFYKILLSK